MTASRVKTALVAALCFGVSAQALAQTPMDLTPGENPAPEQAPVELTPPEAPAPAVGGPAQPASSEVSVETLDAINPDVVNVLSPDQGGFGPLVWTDTPRPMLDALMVGLPVTTQSPTLNTLMGRLMMSGGEVDTQGAAPGAFFVTRANLLAAMGDFSGFERLLNAVPNRTELSGLAATEVDVRLLSGDNARACELAGTEISRQTSNAWQKIFIFCQALSGQTDQAALGLGLLREMGEVDAPYFQLMEALVQGAKPPEIVSLSNPSAVHLALMRVAQAKMPVDVLESNRPEVLRAIAVSPNAPAELRLEAAERAQSSGALPADSLRQIYASIPFEDAQLNSPLSAVVSLSGPMGRALLYRAASRETNAATQAEILTKALDLARAGGRYISVASTFKPLLGRLSPSADLNTFAPAIIRAYLMTGSNDLAKPWFDALTDAAKNDADLARARETLMPVARLSGFVGEDVWTVDDMIAWWDTIKQEPGARERATVLASIYTALGEYVPAEIWAPLVPGPSHMGALSPHPALWFRLDDAVMHARTGETVALSAVILGTGGAARADSLVLARVLKALNDIGLHDEARALGLEAALAAGL